MEQCNLTLSTFYPVVIELDKNEYIKRFVINGKEFYTLNLTNHNLNIIYQDQIIEIPPILQARVINQKIYYYDIYGIKRNILKLKLNGKIIEKNNPKLIKIVSIKTLKFIATKLKMRIRDVVNQYNWINPSYIKKFGYYFTII